jgi:hypothetical protein
MGLTAGKFADRDDRGIMSKWVLAAAFALLPMSALAAPITDTKPTFTKFDSTGSMGTGDILKLNAPGAGTGNLQGTHVSGINKSNAITGYYVDSSGIAHGFIGRHDVL